MILADVNLLVYAFRETTADHQHYRKWLIEQLNGHQPFALNGTILSGFLRVVTHPKVFDQPASLDEAVAFVSQLQAAPTAIPLSPGPRHWAIFVDLCRQIKAKGNAIPDAYLAAIAVEHGCHFYSADRGFARFKGLRYSHPLH